ncbi:hypothetical protein [Leptospira haakeii]|uniref:Polyketide cyclase n=1 Tax=Leptospira haakeii TaxID=2023198 RepID=A0ABX4PMQ0_9LEPT|nr:hypothetical protein [Leptospira haakeii]PKA16140.1 hypothetical protein CH363_08305 [Leptospira haakeii]PKA18088.1 hypothetical protein CH377_19495 [Leptospira haakeii]
MVKLNIIVIVSLSFLFSSEVNSEEVRKVIKFDREDYVIVFSNETGSNLIKEYLRKNDSLEKWNKMITIFDWKNVSQVNEILPKYLEQVITPNSIRKPNILKNTKSGYKEDYIFEFFLSTASGDYIEYNLHRMITTNDNKVISFIFALKITMTGDKQVDSANVKNALEPNRINWLAEIGSIGLE